MKWIKEHKLISVFLAILIVLVLLFTISEKSQTGTLTVGQKVTSVVQKIAEARNETKKVAQKTETKEDLIKKIDELEAENEELKKQISEIKLKREELNELDELSKVLSYEYVEQTFDLVTCNLISKDNSLYISSFIIDKGTNSGIKVNDAVVNGMGLIGKIKEVGNDYAKVVSIIDSNQKISFKVARDSTIEGVCYGTSSGKIKGYTMDPEATIAVGDTLITTGRALYPEGIIIGTVTSVTYNNNTLMREIEIEEIVDFRSIDKVSVIK